MSAYRPGIDPDRRKKPDLWVKSLRWIAVIGWFLMVIALFIFSEAKPQRLNFFDKLMDHRPSVTWNLKFTTYIFYLMVIGFFLGITGIFVNIRRHRRKTDEYRVSIILITAISLLGIILYFFLI